MIDLEAVKPANIFAYAPDETPLSEEVVLMNDFQFDEEVGYPSARAEIDSDRSLAFGIIRNAQQPIRTQYGAYFLHRAGDIVICNVDLESIQQPGPATVARALLAFMVPDLPRATMS